MKTISQMLNIYCIYSALTHMQYSARPIPLSSLLFSVFVVTLSAVSTATVIRFGGDFDFSSKASGDNVFGITVPNEHNNDIGYYFVGELTYNNAYSYTESDDYSEFRLSDIQVAIGQNEAEANHRFASLYGNPDDYAYGAMSAGSFIDDKVTIMTDDYNNQSTPVPADIFTAYAYNDGEFYCDIEPRYCPRVHEGPKLGINLTDYDGDAFSRATLKDAYDLSNALQQFDFNRFSILYENTLEEQVYISGPIDWFSVPEPSTLTLFILGLAALFRRSLIKLFKVAIL